MYCVRATLQYISMGKIQTLKIFLKLVEPSIFLILGVCLFGSLVLFPDPTTHARKGLRDIGADSWFCKLSNCDYLHSFCIGARAVT